MMLAIFAGCLDLLCHAAILLLTTRIAAVDNDMRTRGQRTVLPDEVKIAVV
jgi:hypothetical protein